MEPTTHWKEYVFNLLTPSQRIELAMELWDSVPSEQHGSCLTESQMTELRRRIAEADAGRMTGSGWKEVKQRLLHPAP